MFSDFGNVTENRIMFYKVFFFVQTKFDME